MTGDSRKRVVRLVSLNLNPRDLSIALIGLRQYAQLDETIRERTDIHIHQFEKNYARRGEPDTVDGLVIDDVVATLDPMGTDLFGFSTYVWNMDFMVAVAARLKELNPRAVTLFGGSQAGGYGKRFLRDHPQADYVIKGEAELTFRQFLRGWLEGDPTDTLNLIYRRGEEVAANFPDDPAMARRQSFIKSIEELPYPFRDPEYRAYLDNLKHPVTAQFETERGCPLSCAFCSWGTQLPIRRRRQEDVEEGLTYLLNHPNVRAVFIVDANPFIKNDKGLWLTEYLLHKNKTGKPVFFELNPEYIKDPRVIENLGKLSGDELAFGLQSTADHTLKIIKRRFNRDIYERSVRRLRALNPDACIKFSLIVGLPGDNLDSFLGSLDFVISLVPSDIYVHDLLVLPGSEMYDDPASYGLTIDHHPPHRLISNETFPPDQYLVAKKIGYYAKLVHKMRGVRDALLALQAATGLRHVDLYRRFVDHLEDRGVNGLGEDLIDRVSSEEFDFRSDRFVSSPERVELVRRYFDEFRNQLLSEEARPQLPPAPVAAVA